MAYADGPPKSVRRRERDMPRAPRAKPSDGCIYPENQGKGIRPNERRAGMPSLKNLRKIRSRPARRRIPGASIWPESRRKAQAMDPDRRPLAVGHGCRAGRVGPAKSGKAKRGGNMFDAGIEAENRRRGPAGRPKGHECHAGKASAEWRNSRDIRRPDAHGRSLRTGPPGRR